VLDRLERAGYASRAPDPGHRRRTLVRQTPRAEELGEEIFAPVISGTIRDALAYPDAALASIAEFLAAHRALLTRYLTTVSPAVGDPGPGTSASARAEP
jgi:DNA-binding MarR family transcriptional regulator